MNGQTNKKTNKKLDKWKILYRTRKTAGKCIAFI